MPPGFILSWLLVVGRGLANGNRAALGDQAQIGAGSHHALQLGAIPIADLLQWFPELILDVAMIGGGLQLEFRGFGHGDFDIAAAGANVHLGQRKTRGPQINVALIDFELQRVGEAVDFDIGCTRRHLDRPFQILAAEGSALHADLPRKLLHR